MPDASLKRTPLDTLHDELGARMVGFAGYRMPVQYPRGIIKEHLHARSRAALFDVSHMGQVRLSGADAAAALETLVPADIVGLPEGRQRYTLFTNEAGGVLDDLMVSNLGDSFFLVVNAARKERDVGHLASRIGSRCRVELLEDRALLALQGPEAAAVMRRLCAPAAALPFMGVARIEVAGVGALVSRSGYTGEDGFEISVDARDAARLARELLAQPEVAPAGLGARDSLRLEAGLCLYGHELDESITPVAAGLAWTIGKARRAGGARAGGFPGADVILAGLDAGPKRLRVGLLPEGRIPVREGEDLLDAGGTVVGRVSSGGFGPSLNAPIAMGYVQSAHAATGTELRVVIRGKPRICRVAALPLVPHRYHRNAKGD